MDQLLAGADPASAFEDGGLLDHLKTALAERTLNAERDHHLAQEAEAGNARNGYGRKSVLTKTGPLDLAIPRDRKSSFDPKLIAKYQRRFPGFDDKIISMYARGMSTRESVGHVREIYGVDVSPDLISAVTDAILNDVATWQARPLEAAYPLVFLNALRVKIRDEGMVRNKAVHLALGVRGDGTKEVLGLWIETNEGAKFWLRVLIELRARAVDVEAGATALDAFEQGPWGQKYAAIPAAWRRAWPEVIPFFAFAEEVRKLIYTTTAIEALNSMLRRAVRARGHFPSDEAAAKMRFLVLNRAEKDWKTPPREWGTAKAPFAILFGERFTKAMA